MCQHRSDGEAQGTFTHKGLKCADGEPNYEGAAQGSSNYQRNAKISTFPVSFHLHCNVLSVFSGKNPSP